MILGMETSPVGGNVKTPNVDRLAAEGPVYALLQQLAHLLSLAHRADDRTVPYSMGNHLVPG